jgi:iron complex outermembrane recepter protein
MKPTTFKSYMAAPSLLVIITALSAGGAQAQATSQVPSAAPAVAVEEVIVTARKKRETLQETPISITAFTAAALQKTGSTTINDIALRTPGLQYGNFGDVKLSPTSLRGVVGGAGSAGADPAVGYYVDEVFVGQGVGANLDLYDIERVEILRGPQGTLFGRNTIAGVISITTKKPTDEVIGSASISYGNYDETRLAGSLSGPIVADFLSGKISAVYNKRDGTSRNTFLNRDVNTIGNWTMRGQLLFTLSDRTNFTLTAEHSRVDQEPLVFDTLRYNPTAAQPNLLDAFGLPRNLNALDRRVQSDTITQERSKGTTVSGTFRTNLNGVGITNITSHHQHDYFSRVDTDRSPLQIIYDGDPEKVKRFSEELRLDFKTGPVNWLVGGYYFKQNSKNLSFVELGSLVASLFGDPSLTGIRTGSNAELDVSSAAGFANAAWQITPQFDVSIGGRYTNETKKIDYAQNDPISLLGGTFALKGKSDFSQFTPSFNARYRFTRNILGYGAISKGFKSGGFNDALGDANGIAFGPESLINYELGLKNRLFDGRVTLNIAAFYMKWSDIQLTQDNPATPVFDSFISNAGAAHSQGLEVELNARPTDAFNLGASFSLQDAQYDEGTTVTGVPLRYIPFSPKYTGNLNASYSLPVSGIGTVTLFGEALLKGRTYLTVNNDVDGIVDNRTVFNARLTLATLNDRLSITAYGKNLSDEKYFERLFDLTGTSLIGQKFVILNNPRTYGIEAKLDF